MLRDLTPMVQFKHHLEDQTARSQLPNCGFKVAHIREVLGRINLSTTRWNAWHAGRAALRPLNRPGSPLSLSFCQVVKY